MQHCFFVWGGRGHPANNMLIVNAKLDFFAVYASKVKQCNCIWDDRLLLANRALGNV